MITVSRGEVYPRTWIYDGRERKAYQFSLTVVEDGVTRRVRGQARRGPRRSRTWTRSARTC
jgi:hypothetical protein